MCSKTNSKANGCNCGAKTSSSSWPSPAKILLLCGRHSILCLKKKRARQAAKETLSYFDFFLQPQIVMYAKIAAIHGFDLGIDHEIAPKEAIAYAPLPEGEYQDPFDFMRTYDLDFPYEYLQNWVDYYTGQTDTLGLPPLVNDE